MSADDVGLVQRCLRGDAGAIGQVLERFQADVYGLCVRLLGDRHEAEDAAQEVFLRVFRSLRRWDSTRPLRPWVMGITVNRCRTFLGRRARRPEPRGELCEPSVDGQTDDTAELLSEVRRALQRIRTEFREVFVLFHEQGMTYEAIAQALGRPVGTIKTWLHRARHEVLEHLQARGMVDEVSHEMP